MRPPVQEAGNPIHLPQIPTAAVAIPPRRGPEEAAEVLQAETAEAAAAAEDAGKFV